MAKRPQALSDDAARDVKARIIHRYENEIAQIAEDVRQAKEALDLLLMPIYEERQHVCNEGEFLSAARDAVALLSERQAAPEKSHISLDKMFSVYQEKIEEAFHRVIEIYSTYPQERDQVYRDGEFIPTETEEQIAAELDAFSAMVRAHYLERYLGEVRPDFSNLERALADVQAKIEENNAQIDDVMERYTATGMETQTRLHQLERRMVKKQNQLEKERTFLATQTALTEVEQWCMEGDLTNLNLYMAEVGNDVRVERLMEDAPLALPLACRYGHAEVVSTLLGAGLPAENPETFGREFQPIHYAVQHQGETLEIILNVLRTRGIDFTAEGPLGRTPLHTATFYGNTEAVRLLLEVNSNPEYVNAREKGRFQKNTALHNAAYCGDIDSISLLYAHEANPNARNGSGNTPMMAMLCSPRLAIDDKIELLEIFHRLGCVLTSFDHEGLRDKPEYETEVQPVFEALGVDAAMLTNMTRTTVGNSTRDTTRGGFSFASALSMPGSLLLVRGVVHDGVVTRDDGVGASTSGLEFEP